MKKLYFTFAMILCSFFVTAPLYALPLDQNKDILVIILINNTSNDLTFVKATGTTSDTNISMRSKIIRKGKFGVIDAEINPNKNGLYGTVMFSDESGREVPLTIFDPTLIKPSTSNFSINTDQYNSGPKPMAENRNVYGDDGVTVESLMVPSVIVEVKDNVSKR